VLSIRPIWAIRDPEEPPPHEHAELRELFDLRLLAAEQVGATMRAAVTVHGDDSIESIRPIIETAEADLHAGCELARGGYFKQSYSLWRAWYEQTLFSFYFLEAPLHRSVWRSVDTIVHGKQPLTRLMLHDVLVSGGDKAHPFAVAYFDRYSSLAAALGLPVPGKKNARAPLEVATNCFTDLSQGVHGTYRPARLRTAEELPAMLRTHAIPVLRTAVTVVGMFGFLCIQSQLSLTDAELIKMRDDSYAPTGGDEDATCLAPVAPQLRAWLKTLKGS
jgi:hypothetical protein